MSPGDEDARRGPKVPFGRAPERPAAASSIPKVLFGSARGSHVPSDQPRIIGGGVARRRIPCTIEDLRAASPAASDTVLRQALRAVSAVNFDDHQFDDVVRFGSTLQDIHGRLAEQQLSLVSDPRLSEAKRLSTALLQQIEQFDPQLLFPADEGILMRGIRAAFSRTGSPEAFMKASATVIATARSLRERAPDLRDLADNAATLGKRFATLTTTLEAYILAGSFLVTHLDAIPPSGLTDVTHLKSQKDALEIRLAALASALASVTLGKRILETVHMTVDAARSIAEDIVENELPAWQIACAAALAARVEERPFDLSSVRERYEKIVNILKRRMTT